MYVRESVSVCMHICVYVCVKRHKALPTISENQESSKTRTCYNITQALNGGLDNEYFRRNISGMVPSFNSNV